MSNLWNNISPLVTFVPGFINPNVAELEELFAEKKDEEEEVTEAPLQHKEEITIDDLAIPDTICLVSEPNLT